MELIQTKRLGYLSALAVGLLMLAAGPARAYAGRSVQGAKMLQPSTAVRIPGERNILAHITAETPLTGSAHVLPIIATRNVEGRDWLRVRLAGRPNGRTGWIPASDAQVINLRWRILIDRSSRVMVIYKDGRRARRLRVIVGARITPTPIGHFSVMEHVRLGAKWSRYGWGLALSAFSEILKHYDGGQGQVAIHARGTLEGALGTASSHGCIRVRDTDASWLAHRIPNGTPVDIQR